jgi:hypothetical protein
MPNLEVRDFAIAKGGLLVRPKAKALKPRPRWCMPERHPQFVANTIAPASSALLGVAKQNPGHFLISCPGFSALGKLVIREASANVIGVLL